MNGDVSPPIAAPLGDVTTERLRLRTFAKDDLDELAAVFAKPEVWRFPYGRGLTRDETEEFLHNQIEHWNDFGFGCWLMLAQPDDRVAGYVGLSIPRFLPEILPAVEVGWRLDPDYWGRGLATEGAKAALREGFTTMRLDSICSLPQSDNAPSYRVCDRLGMTLERTIVCPPTHKRGAVEARLYTMTRRDYRA